MKLLLCTSIEQKLVKLQKNLTQLEYYLTLSLITFYEYYEFVLHNYCVLNIFLGTQQGTRKQTRCCNTINCNMLNTCNCMDLVTFPFMSQYSYVATWIFYVFSLIHQIPYV